MLFSSSPEIRALRSKDSRVNLVINAARFCHVSGRLDRDMARDDANFVVVDAIFKLTEPVELLVQENSVITYCVEYAELKYQMIGRGIFEESSIRVLPKNFKKDKITLPQFVSYANMFGSHAIKQRQEQDEMSGILSRFVEKFRTSFRDISKSFGYGFADDIMLNTVNYFTKMESKNLDEMYGHFLEFFVADIAKITGVEQVNKLESIDKLVKDNELCYYYIVTMLLLFNTGGSSTTNKAAQAYNYRPFVLRVFGGEEK